MPPVQKRTVSLPAKQARFIDSKVRAGTYASASEVGPVYDAMKADPKRAVSAKKAFAAVRARHAEKLKASKRGA